jgi:hypothetical protein
VFKHHDKKATTRVEAGLKIFYLVLTFIHTDTPILNPHAVPPNVMQPSILVALYLIAI